MRLIDLEAIRSLFYHDGAFHYPDWVAIWDAIESNVIALDHEAAWNEAGALWLETLREDLGGACHLHQSPFSYLLCDQPEREAIRLLAFLDKSITSIKEMIGDAAWQGGFGKRAAIVFGELDDYNQYISHYSMDGEQAASGGVSIGHGFSHIALPWTTGESVRG